MVRVSRRGSGTASAPALFITSPPTRKVISLWSYRGFGSERGSRAEGARAGRSQLRRAGCPAAPPSSGSVSGLVRLLFIVETCLKASGVAFSSRGGAARVRWRALGERTPPARHRRLLKLGVRGASLRGSLLPAAPGAGLLECWGRNAGKAPYSSFLPLYF